MISSSDSFWSRANNQTYFPPELHFNSVQIFPEEYPADRPCLTELFRAEHALLPLAFWFTEYHHQDAPGTFFGWFCEEEERIEKPWAYEVRSWKEDIKRRTLVGTHGVSRNEEE